jgi:hypothetical protein
LLLLYSSCHGVHLGLGFHEFVFNAFEGLACVGMALLGRGDLVGVVGDLALDLAELPVLLKDFGVKLLDLLPLLLDVDMCAFDPTDRAALELSESLLVLRLALHKLLDPTLQRSGFRRQPCNLHVLGEELLALGRHHAFGPTKLVFDSVVLSHKTFEASLDLVSDCRELRTSLPLLFLHSRL